MSSPVCHVPSVDNVGHPLITEMPPTDCMGDVGSGVASVVMLQDVSPSEHPVTSNVLADGIVAAGCGDTDHAPPVDSMSGDAMTDQVVGAHTVGADNDASKGVTIMKDVSTYEMQRTLGAVAEGAVRVHLVNHDTKTIMPYDFPPAVVRLSSLLTTLKESMRDGSFAVDEVPPMPCIPSDILSKIEQFCEKYAVSPMHPIPAPLERKSTLRETVSPWYIDFLSIPPHRLTELFEASDFLNIEPLCSLVGAGIATLLFDMPLHEYETQFGIVNDHTPEEMAELNRYYQECFGSE